MKNLVRRARLKASVGQVTWELFLQRVLYRGRSTPWPLAALGPDFAAHSTQQFRNQNFTCVINIENGNNVFDLKILKKELFILKLKKNKNCKIYITFFWQLYICMFVNFFKSFKLHLSYNFLQFLLFDTRFFDIYLKKLFYHKVMCWSH